MAEDWRVTITLTNEDDARRVLNELRERDVRSELRDELGGRVAVSHDGPSIFLYANDRRGAEAGERAVREILDEHDLHAQPALDRWHPIEERWEDASVPLPSTDAERDAERERAEADDERESIETGVAQWEVRVETDSASQAEALAAELESEGYDVVRRSAYLLVGTNDEDDADALAQRLEGRGRVHVEPGAGVAWQLMPGNPFAIFGGLGA